MQKHHEQISVFTYCFPFKGEVQSPMRPRYLLILTVAIHSLLLSPAALQAQRSSVCDAFYGSVHSLSKSLAGDDVRAYVPAAKEFWHQYQQKSSLPKSQLTYSDKRCLVLWYGGVQALDPRLLQMAEIPVEPDLAWMLLDAKLADVRGALREARAKHDSEWEESFLREEELYSRNQGQLRPNFVKVVITNKEGAASGGSWSPIAEVTSQTKIATLTNATIPVKLYSDKKELIWEGQFKVARLAPRGGKATVTGTGRLRSAKSIDDIEIGDAQFTFEHRQKQ